MPVAFTMLKNKCFLLFFLLAIPSYLVGKTIQIDSIVSPAIAYNNRLQTVSFRQVDSAILLRPDQNFFYIYFHTPDTVRQVEYQLQGLETYFLTTTNRYVYYTNVPDGQYTFLVRVKRNPQINQRLVITVESVAWRKWWFSPLVFLFITTIIGMVFYFFYLYRIRQFLRLQQTRDRIARDLHDDMGSYLSSISILSRSAQRSVTKDPAKAQATLDRIGQTARQVMDSMGDIVWSINPDHDSMTQVIARMTDVASALFSTDNDHSDQVSWQVDVADEVRQIRLLAENRRDFFLIYKEAITNAAKYAQASRVSVRLRCEGSFLCLEVADNGRGFDPQNPERLNPSGGNGLRNMQNRAALLNGTLVIRSEPGQGTTLTIRFPV